MLRMLLSVERIAVHMYSEMRAVWKFGGILGKMVEKLEIWKQFWKIGDRSGKRETHT